MTYHVAMSSAGKVTTDWFKAAAGLIAASLIWWTYVKTGDPSISTPLDLLRQNVSPYGGMAYSVTQSTYFALLGLAFVIGLLFVCVGWLICRWSAAFNITSLSAPD